MCGFIDHDKVVAAKTTKFRQKVVNLTDLKRQVPRGSTFSYLRSNDRLHNVELENTKDLREIEIQQKLA